MEDVGRILRMHHLLSVFLLFYHAAEDTVAAVNITTPVILVPGDGGSQFEAKLDKPETVHMWCQEKSTDWFSFWLNLEELAPYIIDCFVDNMRLEYNRTTHTTHNPPGVQTRQPGFGNTTSVEWLDASKLSITAYFNPIAEALVSLGYKRGVSLRGAPYDFRKAPNELGEFFTNLTKLIEETYEINGKKRVTLLGHSMGNVCIVYLLNQKSQSWKDKYIRAFVSLAGPYGGAAKTLRLVASGDSLGVFVVNPLSARPQQRSMPSSAWLLPLDTYWSADEVLVSGPLGNYTVKDYPKFFKDIDFEDGLLMRQDTEKYLKNLKAPGVEMYCTHGVDVPTPSSFHYGEKAWHDSQPDVVWGPGDGTVNMRSLLVCLKWQEQQKQPIHHQTFPGVAHMGILDNKNVTEYIRNLVQTL